MTLPSTLDLHVHSTASDGRLSPAEVVRLAADLGLTAIALTDHETTAGLPEAQAMAAQFGLTVLPGVEIGTETDDGPVDILGYCFDPGHAGLQAALTRLRDGRDERAQEMVGKLNELGIPLTWDEVRDVAGHSVVGRPHVARALVRAGHIAQIGEAFERWIGAKGPAYVARLRITPQEAIALVNDAGGLASLAHPIRSSVLDSLPALVEAGLGGLEVYYPQHTRKDVKRLLRLCKRHNLVPTGGSDFHGLALDGTSTLGSVAVPPDSVERLPCNHIP